MLPAHRIPTEVTAACLTLQEAGFATYVVGGAVRDLLRCPNDDTAKDFDLTTAATPEQVIAVFGRRKVIPTGIAHGTVTVLCERPSGKPHPIEITTFRGEVGFSDGQTFRIPFELMRIYSPSAEVQGHGPGQEVLQTGKREVELTELEPVGNYAVRLVFDDGHDTGLYTWDYLYELGARHAEYWRKYLAALTAAGIERKGEGA